LQRLFWYKKESLELKNIMETFKKEERLCNKKIIKNLFSKANSFFDYPFKILWIETDIKTNFPAQVLINVSKNNFKKAVDRNKIKRLIREAYRKNKFSFYEFLLKQKKQCAFAIIYTSKEILSYQEIEKIIILILQRLQKEYEKNIK